MTKGVIYVLTNPAFPEFVKIGYADDIETRLKQLNKSECLPFAFRVYCVYEVEDRLKDKDVHAIIDKLNPGLRAIETFDGKSRTKEFYAMSAEDAYELLESIAKISNTVDHLKLMKPEGHEILDEEEAEKVRISKNYTEQEHIDKCNSDIEDLYYKLKERVLDLGDITVVPTKLYLSFKGKNNICDIVFKKDKLKITLNLKKVDDPNGICEYVKNKGHWGVGDYRVIVYNEDELDDVIEVIKQSYDKNK